MISFCQTTIIENNPFLELTLVVGGMVKGTDGEFVGELVGDTVVGDVLGLIVGLVVGLIVGLVGELVGVPVLAVAFEMKYG